MNDSRPKSTQTRRLYRSILKLLPAFESAARLQSFTLAGEEIGLVQSAVSKQIMELESRIGQPLFNRDRKSISLTPIGRRLLASYSFAESHMLDTLDDLAQESARRQIVLSTSTANAAFLLLPRVAELRECFEGGEIFVVTSDPQGIEPSGRVDFALAFGKPELEGFQARPLFRDILTPVCSLAYLDRHGPIAGVDALRSCELLYMQAQHPSWTGWRQWMRHFSVELSDKQQSMGFDNYYNAIQACVAGQGVALGWLRLLGDYLEAGQLVTPLTEYLESDEQYYLVWSEHRRLDYSIEPFERWLRQRFGGEVSSFLNTPSKS